jgi:cytochrome c oxidase subunit 2
VFPNRETRIWFTAREAGSYPGACAEFCGLQHAKMLFYVMAESPEDFDAWVTCRQADSAAAYMRPAAPVTDSLSPAPLPEDPMVAQGRQLFMAKACMGCHQLGSAGANTAIMGPNLAGIGTRKMIGAGWLENTDEHLARWIQNPDQYKQGTLMGTAMTNAKITDAEAQALVAYLRTRQ